jgi:hypothetical protein
MRQFVTGYYYDDPIEFKETLSKDVEKHQDNFGIAAMSTVEKYWGWRILGVRSYHTTVVWEWKK